MSETRTKVAELVAEGVTPAEIARRLGLSKSTVSYHAGRLGKPIDRRCARRYDWAAVQRFYDEGHSVRECQRRFGFSRASWHAAVGRGRVTPRERRAALERLFADGTFRNRWHLTARMLQDGLRDGSCEACGIVDWRGQPLTMALHHVNGDRLDNQLENLRLLCPNCHAQTATFAGRNGRRRSDAP